MKTYCSNNGYDYTTLEAQLRFLNWDLADQGKWLLNYLKNIENTANGAYNAAYYFCESYEKPSNAESKGKTRGILARDAYWSYFSTFLYTTPTTQTTPSSTTQGNGHTNNSQLRPGTIINEVLHTDIKAFIDDRPIRSFNIDGYTAVMAEDLSEYGFRVVYKNDTRSLYIDEGNKKVTSTYQHTTNTKPVGSKAMDVYYTDIKTYANGHEIKGYNIDGYTIVFLDDLTAFGKTHWIPEKRVLAFYRYDYSFNSDISYTENKTVGNPAKGNPDVVYNQKDYPIPYLRGTINNVAQDTDVAKSGCGVVALANAIHYLTGYDFTYPDIEDIAQFAISSGDRKSFEGTKKTLAKNLANSNLGSKYKFTTGEQYRVKNENFSEVRAQINDCLDNNGAIYFSVTSSDGGHIMCIVNRRITATGISEYLVLDSYPSSNRLGSGVSWKWCELTDDLDIKVGNREIITRGGSDSAEYGFFTIYPLN